MTFLVRFKSVRPTEEFLVSYHRLPLVIQEAVNGALRDLASEQIPASRCVRQLPGSTNPRVYTLKPTWNEPYLLSFEADGEVAVLRGVNRYEII